MYICFELSYWLILFKPSAQLRMLCNSKQGWSDIWTCISLSMIAFSYLL
jgi:hypothetical protein